MHKLLSPLSALLAINTHLTYAKLCFIELVGWPVQNPRIEKAICQECECGLSDVP